MSPEFIEGAARQITETYGSDRVRHATENGRTFVRIDGVEMPPGCTPVSTTMLLLLDPREPKPHAYITPGQMLANGKTPRSTSIIMIGGESWMQYSFNIPWSEEHGVTRFIAAARQRFAQDA